MCACVCVCVCVCVGVCVGVGERNTNIHLNHFSVAKGVNSHRKDVTRTKQEMIRIAYGNSHLE